MAKVQQGLNVKQVKKGTLKDQICAQIKSQILSNELRPGQTIGIDQLADGLGVSHTPVREALAILEREGLVEQSSYSTPRVTSIDANDVQEVYEMRLMVESWAIEHAVRNLSPETIEEMSRKLDLAREKALISDYSAHLEADIFLHQAIFKSTNNRQFEILAQRVHDRSIRLRSLVELTGNPQDVLKIVEEHCQIVDALRTRDPKLAREKMVDHLNAGMQRTLDVVKEYTRQL